MRICLVTAHYREFAPLALMYLKARLLAAGFHRDDVEMVEFELPVTPAEVARALIARRADVYGLSCYLWNSSDLLAAAAEVRRALSSATIIAGGPDVGSVAAEVLAAHPALDLIVKSEGEPVIGVLGDRWLAGRPIDDVPGIVVRRNGAVVDQGTAPLQVLDDLPSPHLGNVLESFEGRETIQLETQRGCVFRCNFCFENKGFTLRNRRFPIDRVQQELKLWLDRGVPWIYFLDPVFNLNKERAKDICRFIAASNPHGTKFMAEIWAEFVDEELARLMKAARFEYVEVGLQSTDSETLAGIERRLRLQPFLDGVRWLREAGVPTELQLIYGLPGDTMESFWRSLDFAYDLRPFHLNAFRLLVLPGTELREKAAQFGLRYETHAPYYAIEHSTMSAREMAWSAEITEVVPALQKLHVVRTLTREPGVRFSDLIRAWIEQPERDLATGVPAFLARFCESRGIPADFYFKFAAKELEREPAPVAAS
ncbi:MAG: radical SAM protein [Acidobacteriota bacterium]